MEHSHLLVHRASQKQILSLTFEYHEFKVKLKFCVLLLLKYTTENFTEHTWYRKNSKCMFWCFRLDSKVTGCSGAFLA